MKLPTGNTKPLLPATSGAIVFYQGKILMIKRDNNPNIPNPNKWSIPGGCLEKGESFNQALKRELKEEINIIPENYIFCGVLSLIKDNKKRAIYFIKLKDKEYKKVKLGNEGQEIGWFPLEEVEKIDAVEEIRNLLAKYKKQIKSVLENKLKLEKFLQLLQKDGVLEANII